MPDGLKWSPEDALAAHIFSFEVDGIEIPQVSEISGLNQDHEVITNYATTSQGKLVLKLTPGKQKPVTVTLKRFGSASTALADWYKKVQDGDVKGARCTASVVVYDYDRSTEVSRINLINAFPVKITHGSLKADGNALLSEEVTIQAEIMQRVK